MNIFEADRLDRRDARLIDSILPFVRCLNQRYLRLRAEGFENLEQGPVLYVGNHNGGIAGPDIACTLGSLWNARGADAPYLSPHPLLITPVLIGNPH